MCRSLATRCVFAALIVGGCALAAGCLSGNPSYFPYLLPAGDPAVQTHAKPPGPGYFADYDPYACRIVVRPELCTAPVRGTQVFIATVYDGEGNPRRKRRVEWMVEGPGNIVEVDESGYLPGRGMKVDNKYAFSYTDYFEHCITRGRDEFTIRPGQTWCVVTSAVEGETTVIAYCPAINDWEKNRAYVKVSWVDGNLLFPPPVTARAGSNSTLKTTISDTEQAAGYRVRYRILDGPAAALTTLSGGEVTSVREAVAPVGPDGNGRVQITQPLPAAGTNRIGIEVVKPDPADPGRFKVVSRGETRVTWQAPELKVNVAAPRTLGVNQETTVTYTVGGSRDVATGPVTLTARIPAEMVLVKTEPRAAVDGDTLIWTVPLDRSERQTVRATVRPVRLGAPTLTADARTEDGITGRGTLPVSITEAKLVVKLTGPTTGVVGEALPFEITVTNGGDGPADQVRIRGKLDDGLETASSRDTIDETIGTLGAGQSRTIPLPVSARRAGKFGIEVNGSADRGLVAVPQMATVEVKDIQLGLTAHGPARGYVGQEITWQLVVRNTGDVAMGNVAVRAALPPQARFVKATDGGKLVGTEVVWELGTAPGRQERTVAVTAVCNGPVPRAVLTARVIGTPVVEAGDRTRPLSLIKPFGNPKPVEAAVEVVGLPALQVSVKDSTDPVPVGQRVTYQVRVQNAGTQAADKVEVIATLPDSLRPTRGTGPGPAGTLAGQRVTFRPLAALAPGAEATFVVEAEARLPADARFAVEVRSTSLRQPLRAVEPTRIILKESRPFDP